MQSSGKKIHIDVATQQLTLRDAANRELLRFPISSSARGVGSEPGSYKTPVGKFVISEKIGDGVPLGAVFKGRVATGEIGIDALDDDLILSRILWLHGLEAHNANTRDRYIYIHGTNHERAIGTPASHGCIRMRNADIIELFRCVEAGTPVEITG